MKQYFARADAATGRLVGIGTRPGTCETQLTCPIDAELAVKLLDGRESLDQWVVDVVEQVPVVRKLQPAPSRRRVDFLPVVEVLIQPPALEPTPGVDATVLVDRESGYLLLRYNGERIKSLARPLRIYVTREGDPTYLKCTISLDVNTLNEIVRQNQLSRWPNPLRVELADGCTDISLFTTADHKLAAFEIQ